MWCSWNNGFKVYGHQMTSPIVTVRAVIDTGSADEEDPNLYGVSHFAEHMFFKGTSEMNWRDINKEISRIGKGNAYTSFGKTVYHINCLPEDTEDALSLLTKMIFDSQFPEEEIEKERNVILEEYQAGVDSPYNYFYDNSLSNVFGNKLHPIIGTKDSIGTISRNDIVSFAKSQHTQNRIAFIIVGDVEKDYVKNCCNKILKQYSTIPSDTYESLYSDGRNPTNHQFEHTSSQTLMGLYFDADKPSEWENNRYVSWLFECGFGDGGFNYNMLFDQIREKLGLCYFISSSIYNMRGANTIMVCAAMDGDNFDTVRDESIKILEGITKNGFESELFELAKKSLIYNITSKGLSPSTYASEWLDVLFHRPFIQVETVRNAVESLTNEDIKKYAKKVLEDGYSVVRMN